MRPKPYKRGDPFSAKRMNDLVREAKSSREIRASGPGLNNESMGNQVFNEQFSRMRLVVATEDFGIPEFPTDFYDKIDKVPSAKCLMLRLDTEADYIEEQRSVPFRIWDPIAHKNDSSLLSAGDAFYASFNPDTKRWEVVSRSSEQTITMGVIEKRIAPSFYRVNLGTLPRNAFGIADVECTVECQPCSEVYGDGTENCGLSILDPDSLVEVSGRIVTAYDPFSDKIPLKDGTDCVLVKLSGSEAQSRYGYGYGDGDVWVILNGYHEHIVQYREEWDCCDPTGPPTLLRKIPVILIGVECEPIECGACPEIGSSGSGSSPPPDPE